MASENFEDNFFLDRPMLKVFDDNPETRPRNSSEDGRLWRRPADRFWAWGMDLYGRLYLDL